MEEVTKVVEEVIKEAEEVTKEVEEVTKEEMEVTMAAEAVVEVTKVDLKVAMEVAGCRGRGGAEEVIKVATGGKVADTAGAGGRGDTDHLLFYTLLCVAFFLEPNKNLYLCIIIHDI